MLERINRRQTPSFSHPEVKFPGWSEQKARLGPTRFTRRRLLADRLADYEQQRNAIASPIYDFTQRISNLEESW